MSSRLPQSTNRYGEESITETGGRFAVIKHDSCDETFSGCSSQFLHAQKILDRDCCGRPDLNSNQLTRAALDHDVDLRTILVAKVKERDRLIAPARLSPQFLKNERLEKLAKESPVCRQSSGIYAKQRASQPAVPQVHLRRFDQPAEAVAMPRRQCFHQKHTLQKRDVIADRRSAYLERRCQITDVEESCGFRCGQREEARQRIEGADACEIANI